MLTTEQRRFAFHLVHDEAIRYLFHLRSRYVKSNESLQNKRNSDSTERIHNDNFANSEKLQSNVQTTSKSFDLFMRARKDE